MSIALTGANPLANTRDLSDRVLRAPVPTVSDTSSGAAWVRNPSWLTLTPPGTSDEKFVGLHAVWPDANFLALSAAGNYTVDWGDGSATQDFSSGVVAYKEYDFADADLVNTNAPVTFTASTDTVNRTAHGYSNGNRVSFYNIVTTTGLNEAQSYYVINAAADTFQVSETEGGSAVALTNDGSATLLPYKQVIVQVYPQAGQSLTQLNLHQKHNQTGLQQYTSGFLDIAVAGANLTDVRVGVQTPGATTQTINFNYLEQVNLVRTDCRQLEQLFRNCRSLQYIVDIATSTTAAALNIAVTFTDAGDLVGATAHGFRNGDSVVFSAVNTTTGITADTRYFVINANANDFQVATSYGGSAVALTTNGTGTAIRGTSMQNLFTNCTSLTKVSLFDTASVTNMSSMFDSCDSLATVPQFNTASVTNMSFMFTTCRALTTTPLFNTASVTNMSFMFNACFSLTTVPLFNTASVTNMSNMFNTCNALTKVPLLNTASVTNMSSMFATCQVLTTVPLFNTASVTNMSSMFNNCQVLTTVPLFNTASVTNMSSMFGACRVLITVPLFNTASVTNMSGMFVNCNSLIAVPPFNTASVTSMNGMFSGCFSLTTMPLLNAASVTDMQSLFNNCVSLAVVPALNATAVTSGNFSSTFSGCQSVSSIKATGLKFTVSIASCKLSKARIEEVFDNLGTFGSGTFGSSQTITVTNNYGVGTNTSKASLSLTAGSTTITMADTSGVTTGMYVTGTGTGITTGRTVVSDVSANTLTLTAHGLPNDTPVSFSSLGSTTGVSNGVIYYVVNANTDDFQISLTVGGAAIDLTGTGGNMTLRYPSFVTGVTTNTSVTIDTPLASTGTQTLTFRDLDASAAMLKGWAVTF
jgi:surface protein